MIESRYWKEEIRRIAHTLRRTQKPVRWSERSHCIIERDLMIGFFMLRRLIELKKVSTKICNSRIKIYSFKSRRKLVTRMDGHDIWETYDMDKEILKIKSPNYICNQFIHAYTSFVKRDESRNWSDVYIVSDYDRNDCIWRIPLQTIRTLFLKTSIDYPSYARFTFDEQIGDYKITTD